MSYMLMQAYGDVELEDCLPMAECAPADVKAHIDFQHSLNPVLLERVSSSTPRGWPDPTWRNPWCPAG